MVLGSLGQERDTWPWPTVGRRQGRGAETEGGVNLVQATEEAGTSVSVFSTALAERNVGKENPSVLDSFMST